MGGWTKEQGMDELQNVKYLSGTRSSLLVLVSCNARSLVKVFLN